MIEAVAYKQLLFTRHVQDMAKRIGCFPAEPDFLLGNVLITSPPARPIARSNGTTQVNNLPLGILEGQTQFKVVAPYVRSKRFARQQKRVIEYRCESTIDP